MVTLVLTLYLLLHLALLAWSRSFEQPHVESLARWRLWFLRAMLLGMAYDNAMLAIGPWGVGEGWYEAANVPRYILHVVLLPFVVMYALSAMQACRVPLAAHRGFIGFCWSFVVVGVVYGLWHEVGSLELEPRYVLGHARLVSVSTGPPWATIATNILILPMSFMLWRHAGLRAFFAGALFILVLNGMTGSQPWGFLAGNGAEVVFIVCLLMSERRIVRN